MTGRRVRQVRDGRPRCPATGKVRLRDELAAKLALVELERLAGTGRQVQIRYYPCADCRGWHLTSRGGGGRYSQRNRRNTEEGGTER